LEETVFNLLQQWGKSNLLLFLWKKYDTRYIWLCYNIFVYVFGMWDKLLESMHKVTFKLGFVIFFLRSNTTNGQ